MKKALHSVFITLLMLLSGWIGWSANEYQRDIDSQVITDSEAETLHENWGDLIIYTPEDGTETFSMTNALTAVAVIKSGMEIHPPHQHTAEEFMYVVEGNGTWSVNGEEFPAKAGDMMYAKPWDWHGITNTGDKPLKFFVVKWDGKGVKVPAQGKR